MKLSDAQLAIRLITKAAADQRAQGTQFRGQLVELAQQLGVRVRASAATETVVRALMRRGRALRESQVGLVRDAHTTCTCRQHRSTHKQAVAMQQSGLPQHAHRVQRGP